MTTSLWRRHRNSICRVSVIYFFCLEGILTGTWASQLPAIQDRSNLSDGTLGLCVLFVYFGTVFATPFAGALNRAVGSKWSTITGGLLFILSLPLVGIKLDLIFLIFGMLMFGTTMGIMDVSMNASGVVAELVAGQPLMGSFHGSYSIAAAIGSLVGSSLASLDWTPLEIFLAVCVVMFIFAIIAGGGLYNAKAETYYHSPAWRIIRDNTLHPLNDDSTVSSDHHSVTETIRHGLDGDLTKGLLADSKAPPHLIGTEAEKDETNNDGSDVICGCAVPRGPTLYLCAVGFAASYGEGAIVTWSVIYFKRYMNIPSALDSIGFFTFMICMASGRFSCDYIRKKIGRVKLVRISGFFAAIGILILVLSPSLPASVFFAVLGIASTGVGLSTLIPTMFSSAGHMPNSHAGTSIATVAAFTYCGSIVSPPMVGGVSQGLHSLRYAMLVLFVVLSTITPLSYGIPPETLSAASGHDSEGAPPSFSSSSLAPNHIEGRESEYENGSSYYHPTPSLLSPLLPYSDLKQHTISVDSGARESNSAGR